MVGAATAPGVPYWTSGTTPATVACFHCQSPTRGTSISLMLRTHGDKVGWCSATSMTLRKRRIDVGGCFDVARVERKRVADVGGDDAARGGKSRQQVAVQIRIGRAHV